VVERSKLGAALGRRRMLPNLDAAIERFQGGRT
jgi:hypothetical protein